METDRQKATDTNSEEKQSNKEHDTIPAEKEEAQIEFLPSMEKQSNVNEGIESEAKISREILAWRELNKLCDIDPYSKGHFVISSLAPENMQPKLSGSNFSFPFSPFFAHNECFYIFLDSVKGFVAGRIGSGQQSTFPMAKLLGLKENSKVAVEAISISQLPNNNMVLVFLNNFDLMMLFMHEKENKLSLSRFPVKISLKCSISHCVWQENTIFLNADNELQTITFSNVELYPSFQTQEDFSSNFKYDKLFVFAGSVDDFDVSRLDKHFFVLSKNRIIVLNGIGVEIHIFQPALESGETINNIRAFRQKKAFEAFAAKNSELNFPIGDMILSTTNKRRILVHDLNLMKLGQEENFRVAKFDITTALKLPFAFKPEVLGIKISPKNDKIFVYSRQLNCLVCLKVNEFYQKPSKDLEENKDIIPFIEGTLPLILPRQTTDVAFGLVDSAEFINRMHLNAEGTSALIKNKDFQNILAVTTLEDGLIKSFDIPLDMIFKLFEEITNQSLINTDDKTTTEKLNPVESKSSKRAKKTTRKATQEDAFKEGLISSESDANARPRSHKSSSNKIPVGAKATDPVLQNKFVQPIAEELSNEKQTNKHSKTSQKKSLEKVTEELQNQKSEEGLLAKSGTKNFKANIAIRAETESAVNTEMINAPTLTLESKPEAFPTKISGVVDVRAIEEMMYRQTEQQVRETNQTASAKNKKESNDKNFENKAKQEEVQLATPQFYKAENSKPFSFQDPYFENPHRSPEEKIQASPSTSNFEALTKILEIAQQTQKNPIVTAKLPPKDSSPSRNKIGQTRSASKKNKKLKPNEETAKRDPVSQKEKDVVPVVPETAFKKSATTDSLPLDSADDHFKKNLNELLISFHDRLLVKLQKNLREVKSGLHKELQNSINNTFKDSKRAPSEDMNRYIEKLTTNTFNKASNKFFDSYSAEINGLSAGVIQKMDAQTYSLSDSTKIYSKKLESHCHDSKKLQSILKQAAEKMTEEKEDNLEQKQPAPDFKSLLNSLAQIQEDQNSMADLINSLSQRVQMLENTSLTNARMEGINQQISTPNLRGAEQYDLTYYLDPRFANYGHGNMFGRSI